MKVVNYLVYLPWVVHRLAPSYAYLRRTRVAKMLRSRTTVRVWTIHYTPIHLRGSVGINLPQSVQLNSLISRRQPSSTVLDGLRDASHLCIAYGHGV